MFRILVIVLAFSCTLAQAQPIYKAVDENGKVIYSNTPIKGGKKVELTPISTVPSPPPSAAPKESTPPKIVDTSAHRKELEDQLTEARKRLDEARQALKEGEESPETYRTPSGAVRRNVPAYEEKMKQLQEAVDQRAQEVENIQKELSSLQ
jgi:gas vesicle protein